MKCIIQRGKRNYMRQPTIDQYLIANCLYIIDEFNILYRNYEDKVLKMEADEKFNEMDITVRLGYPFKQNVHYAAGDGKRAKKLQKINHDLYVEQLDFRIEVKYLKNWISSANTRAASKNWSALQQDFDWLMDEIENGKKGKVAFVIGWFNCVDCFPQIIQLGKGGGTYPLVDEMKKVYFPFLVPKSNKIPIRTKDLDYDYTNTYKETYIRLSSQRKEGFHCMFIGKRQDKFHFALYY